MEAIALFLTKFSEELIGAQVALLSFTLCVATYWLLIRKKKRESAEWVPAALVRAYLDRMQADERETRMRLFGEVSQAPMNHTLPGMASAMMASGSVDPNVLKENEALRSQLAMADQRAMEFDRMMNGLRAEKSALEQRLKEAQASGGSASAAPGQVPAEMQKEVEDLRAKLEEYQILEDEIASVKHYKKENDELKLKVQQYEKGGAALSVVPGGKDSPDASATVVSNTTEKIETGSPIVVSGGASAAPQPAVVEQKAEAAPAAAPALAGAARPASEGAESNTNVLQPVTPTVDTGAATPVAEASSQKKEEELLSEFEKMLAS